MSSSTPRPFPPLSVAWRPIVASIVLLILAWNLRHTAMLFFGGVLVAATLRALADPLAATGRVSPRIALGLVVILVPLVLALVIWWLGDPLAAQLQSLGTDVPRAWEALKTWLESSAMGARVLDLVNELLDAPVPWAGIANLATATLAGVSAVVLVVLMGVYLAFDVGLYKRGLVRLFPVRHRISIEAALDDSGHALTRWLLGQGIAMVAVGVVVAAGLALLGMPLALALGLIAGLLEFIPFFGPIASGLLAVLVAFVQGPQAALYVALLFTAVQQIEGNLLIPLVQRWAVRLPPVLGVAAVIVFGSLFGLPGVLFGTPLMVVAMVLVRKLYIEQMLEGKSP